MSEWKEEAAKRRDFRHTHGGPEVAKVKPKSRKKPWKLVGTWSLFCEPRPANYGRYKTEKAAEQAKEDYNKRRFKFWGKLTIEKD